VVPRITCTGGRNLRGSSLASEGSRVRGLVVLGDTECARSGFEPVGELVAQGIDVAGAEAEGGEGGYGHVRSRTGSVGSEMRPAVRWTVAGMATIAAFGVVTWVCGAFVLPAIMSDAPTRWSIAGCLGVAVAALVALWGHSFATDGKTSEPSSSGDPSAPAKVTIRNRGNVRNIIKGGIFRGSVTQARDIYGQSRSGTEASQEPERKPRGDDQ
jgi:hypothetical protein